jgi:hypothetical protein
MKKKDKKLLASVKARTKAKVEARNKGGAIVRDLDKPDGPYTKVIVCVECGAERKVKPQDAWQVKRCTACQEKKSGAKLKELVARKSSPEARKDDRVKRALSKLDAWVKQNDEDCANFAKYRKRLEEESAKEPKLKRVWPK